MQMEPPTASPMPMNFCSDPASRLSMTAIIAVNTGICIPISTPCHLSVVWPQQQLTRSLHGLALYT